MSLDKMEIEYLDSTGSPVGTSEDTPLPVASRVKGDSAVAFTLAGAAITSDVIDARGAIGIIVDTCGVTWTSGTATIGILGSVDNTTFKPSYQTNGPTIARATVAISSAYAGIQTSPFYGLPDYIKINVTGTFAVTGPVKYQLIY